MQQQKAVIVEVLDPHKKEVREEYFEEFRLLVETLNINIVAETTQFVKNINYSFYLGKGKVEELREIAKLTEANYIFIDAKLTFLQLRNLSRVIEIPCIDRPHLILMIFSMRAKSAEGKLQVELSDLRMRLPEIVHSNMYLDQQTASLLGLKGPGERKTELKRRYIEARIGVLEEKIKTIKKGREERRKKRRKSNIPIVSIVGYTNSGKSTLLNRLTDANAHVEDMLFATLDTLVREGDVGNGEKVLFIDTIGFIRDLPPALIYAFHSTLEEILDSWLILLVVDISEKDFEEKMRIVEDTIKELGGEAIPELIVFNKIDKIDRTQMESLKYRFENAFFISALSGEGMETLKEAIKSMIEKAFVRAKLFIPVSEMGSISDIFEGTRVLSRKDLQDGTFLTVEGFFENVNKFKRYFITTT